MSHLARRQHCIITCPYIGDIFSYFKYIGDISGHVSPAHGRSAGLQAGRDGGWWWVRRGATGESRGIVSVGRWPDAGGCGGPSYLAATDVDGDSDGTGRGFGFWPCSARGIYPPAGRADGQLPPGRTFAAADPQIFAQACSKYLINMFQNKV